MKKIIVLVTVLALAAPAFGWQVGKGKGGIGMTSVESRR